MYSLTSVKQVPFKNSPNVLSATWIFGFFGFSSNTIGLWFLADMMIASSVSKYDWFVSAVEDNFEIVLFLTVFELEVKMYVKDNKIEHSRIDKKITKITGQQEIPLSSLIAASFL